MKLQDYFDFLAPNDIRLKGSRIGIETLLYAYIHRGMSPEQIAHEYPSLTLEQVYATITYYYHKREAIDQYLTEWIEWGRRMREEQAKNPPPALLKLSQVKAEIDKHYNGSVHEYLEAKKRGRAEVSA